MDRSRLMDVGACQQGHRQGQRVSPDHSRDHSHSWLTWLAGDPRTTREAHREAAGFGVSCRSCTHSVCLAYTTKAATTGPAGCLGTRVAIIHLLLRSKHFEPNLVSPGFPLGNTPCLLPVSAN